MTNQLHQVEETNKTNKIISNGKFLEAVFPNLNDGVCPYVASFPGDPKKGNWAARDWKKASNFSPKNNNYYTVSSFKRTDGEKKRNKENFFALHVIVLDDIGTKVDKSLLRDKIKPSYVLMTSEGNFQAGFILGEPIKDPECAERIYKALVAAGLSDPGANQPMTRYMRLPIGNNRKNNQSFECSLVKWRPELRYSVEEIIEGLRLEVDSIERKHQTGKSKKKLAHADGILYSTLENNRVLSGLISAGLYKSQKATGLYEMTCPWVEEHTEQVDNGTAYFEPDEDHQYGGFKCHHGHCADRNIFDLLTFLQIEPEQALMKPVVRMVAGDMHKIVDSCEFFLAQSGNFFQKGGSIVRLVYNPETKENRTVEVTPQALLTIMSSVAIFQRFDKREKGWITIDPTERLLSALGRKDSYEHLKPLKGIAHQPYFHENGTLVSSSGYDYQSQIFSVFDPAEYEINISATKEDACAALSEIEELISEFPFASRPDHAAALGAILTATIRANLPLAPMFHVNAPQFSSGKSYLCSLISLFASSKLPAPANFPTDDEECRKFLLAELMTSPACVNFDNLTSDLLAHKSLCTALTEQYMRGRILGISRTTEVSTNTLFLSSGNNVHPVRDMTRRALIINLDPQCENPVARKFKTPDLISKVLSDRSRYIRAALTIIQAWINAGRPVSECNNLSSFGVWSDLTRQPLMWLGYPDPTISMFINMENDPDKDILGKILVLWYDKYRSKPRMVREVIADFINDDMDDEILFSDLEQLFLDLAEEKGVINTKRLGHWIKRNAGRIVKGLRFEKDNGTRASTAWIVRKI